MKIKIKSLIKDLNSVLTKLRKKIYILIQFQSVIQSHIWLQSTNNKLARQQQCFDGIPF